VGRRDGGNHCAGGERRIWFAGRAAATAQRQGHARAVSSQFVDGAPANGSKRCRCGKKSFETMKNAKLKIKNEAMAGVRLRFNFAFLFFNS
jgi:hypothetical protein